MDEEIPDGELARHERVPHLEARQVLNDRRIPLDLAFFHEQAKGSGREELRVRGDAEQRLRVYG
jgi:hypothetical protein